MAQYYGNTMRFKRGLVGNIATKGSRTSVRKSVNHNESAQNGISDEASQNKKKSSAGRKTLMATSGSTSNTSGTPASSGTGTPKVSQKVNLTENSVKGSSGGIGPDPRIPTIKGGLL